MVDDQNYISKEELERLGMLNIVAQSKRRLDLELQMLEAKQDTQRAVDTQTIQTGNVTLKILETQLMSAREAMRPHRLYHATVGKDHETGKYVCRILDFENPEEEPYEISAFGDTPAEACDNFDALWIGTRT